MNVKSSLLIAAVSFVSLSSFAWDWAGKTGTVELPAGDVEVTEADIATVSALTEIQMPDASTRLVFKTTSDMTLNGMIHGAGTIVKQNDSKLTFAAVDGSFKVDNASADQYTDGGIELEGGTLILPQTSTKLHTYPSVYMNPGTTLFVQSAANTNIRALNGYGTVTNTATSSSKKKTVIGFVGDQTKSVYYGQFCGAGIELNIRGYVELRNEGNTHVGSVTVYRNSNTGSGLPIFGTLALAKFGMRGSPSPLGKTGAIDLRFSGYLLYLGPGGETTDVAVDLRYLPSNGQSGYYNTIDAGAHGGITFTGAFTTALESEQTTCFTFTGSNAAPCTITGSWADDGVGAGYLIKKGSGTWRFGDNASRKNKGGIAVTEGALQFDSLVEAGKVCSLGLATQLQKEYQGKYNPENNVDYAYRLGGGTTNVVFEYTGSDKSLATTRPIALTGSGARFRNSATAGGMLHFEKVSALDAGAKTLWLGGTNVTGRIGEISDGAGSVGVVKEDSGKWTLCGNQTFKGPLEVREGTLAVTTNRVFTWFRFTIRKTNNQVFFCNKIDLFDKDGNRLCRGITAVDPTGLSGSGCSLRQDKDYRFLQPGQAIIGSDREMYYYTAQAGSLNGFFTDSTSGYFRTAVYNPAYVKWDQPTQWVPVVLRLPEGSAEAVAFDIVEQSLTQCVTGFDLEGSVDGVKWVPLLSKQDMTQPSAIGKWYSTDTAFSATAQHLPSADWQFTGHETVAAEPAMLEQVSSIKVCAGATLMSEGGNVALDKLTVDCAATQPCVIDGFDFAETGKIVLENLDRSQTKVVVPMTFENCTGLDNLSQWPVYVGSATRPTSGRLVSATEDGVTVTANGLLLIVK